MMKNSIEYCPAWLNKRVISLLKTSIRKRGATLRWMDKKDPYFEVCKSSREAEKRLLKVLEKNTPNFDFIVWGEFDKGVQNG